MDSPSTAITQHVITHRLSRRASRQIADIQAANDEVNKYMQEALQTSGPFVQLYPSGPYQTRRTVTFVIIRTVVDADGKTAFEPYEASVRVKGTDIARSCHITGPPRPDGQIPVLFTSAGQTQAALADPGDIGPPLEPERKPL